MITWASHSGHPRVASFYCIYITIIILTKNNKELKPGQGPGRFGGRGPYSCPVRAQSTRMGGPTNTVIIFWVTTCSCFYLSLFIFWAGGKRSQCVSRGAQSQVLCDPPNHNTRPRAEVFKNTAHSAWPNPHLGLANERPETYFKQLYNC